MSWNIPWHSGHGWWKLAGFGGFLPRVLLDCSGRCSHLGANGDDMIRLQYTLARGQCRTNAGGKMTMLGVVLQLSQWITVTVAVN